MLLELKEKYIYQIVLSLIVIVITAIVRVLFYKLVQRYSKLHPKIEMRARHIHRINSNIINIIAISVLIGIWGVKSENLFLALSSMFAIIGVALFAQWSVLSNITAGMLIFFTAVFRIGDRITIEDKDFPVEGIVEDILTFHTHIRTDDGRIHVFPNSLFLQKSISLIK